MTTPRSLILARILNLGPVTLAFPVGSSDEYLANAGRYTRALVDGTYDPLLPP